MSLLGTSTSGKSYGLSVKKETTSSLPKSSVFDCDSDSDGEDRPNIQSLQAKHATKAAKQIQQVLEDQPEIYQYDEVYDAMEDSRMRRRRKVQVGTKESKYVSLIKDMSGEREREWERRQERKYQTEREKEGDIYKDKDAYTTPGYKQYLEERKADDEKEIEREKQEELLDVRKRKSLSLFYSHLLTDNVAMGGKVDLKPAEIKGCEDIKVEEMNSSTSSMNVKNSDPPSSEKIQVIESTSETLDVEEKAVLEEKIDVFAKRTTEEMRVAALERYLQRKMKRSDTLQTAST